MDSTPGALLGILMRWLHITSVMVILGGFFYARFVVKPDTDANSRALAGRFRNILYAAIAGVLVSGLYNYLTKSFFPPRYHMVIGIKFLLVLHIFAVAILSTLPTTTAAKNTRLMTGLVFSGLAVLLLSAVLRYLTLAALIR